VFLRWTGRKIDPTDWPANRCHTRLSLRELPASEAAAETVRKVLRALRTTASRWTIASSSAE
jgi:hypothetical protein